MPKSKKKIVVAMSKKKEKKEITRLGQALRALGGLGGSAIGGYIGQAEGGRALGTSLGASLSRWLGSGAYSVSSNTLLKPDVPIMHKGGQSVRVQHREFLGPITGSTTFNVWNEFTLNPANTVTFPWLHQIASCYQQYRILGAIFHYVPTSGVAVSGTNAAIGAVMMQTSYRANDTAPRDKIEMLNEYWSSEGAPNESFVHPIECDPKENPFQIHYTGSPISESDRLLYDIGKVFVATEGMPGVYPVGDLWVTYDIEFKKPVVSTDAIVEYEYVRWYNDATGTAAECLKTPSVEGNYAIKYTTSKLTFPKGSRGRWLIVYDVYAATNFTVCNLDGESNPGGSSDWASNGYTRNQLSGTTPQLNRAYRSETINIINNNATIVYTVPAFTLTPSTGLTSSVRIMKISSDIR